MSIIVLWLRDVGERAAGAYFYAFSVAMPIAAWGDLALWKGAAVAGIGPALSIVKGALASRFGNRASPSLWPDLPLQQAEADPKTTTP